MIIDPNIFCMFRAGNARFCTTFAENSNIFLRISRLGKPSEMPQILEPRFGPASEAPGQGCSWRPPRRLCSAKAPPPRRGRGTPPNAAASNLRRFFLRGPSAAVAEAAGDDERCGQRSSITRSTDKRTMNVSGFNVFKTVPKKQTH